MGVCSRRHELARTNTKLKNSDCYCYKALLFSLDLVKSLSFIVCLIATQSPASISTDIVPAPRRAKSFLKINRKTSNVPFVAFHLFLWRYFYLAFFLIYFLARLIFFFIEDWIKLSLAHDLHLPFDTILRNCNSLKANCSLLFLPTILPHRHHSTSLPPLCLQPARTSGRVLTNLQLPSTPWFLAPRVCAPCTTNLVLQQGAMLKSLHRLLDFFLRPAPTWRRGKNTAVITARPSSRPPPTSRHPGLQQSPLPSSQ